jgi:hypothetical protein
MGGSFKYLYWKIKRNIKRTNNILSFESEKFENLKEHRVNIEM